MMLSLIVALSLLAQAPQLFDRPRLERFLRHYQALPESLVNINITSIKPAAMPGFQEVEVELSAKTGDRKQNVKYLLSNDGRFLVEGQVLRTDQDPFQENREKIELRDQASFGPAIPQVTLVEFSDLQCGYCKQISGLLRRDIPREFPQVKMVFKDFPLSEIHPWAMDASVAGRCIYKQNHDVFWDFHDWAFEQQGNLTPQNLKEKVTAWAAQKKLDTEKLAACTKGTEAKAEVERSLREGKALGITGTPTLFINGRRLVGSQSYGTLKQVIQAELDYLKAPAASK